MKFLFVGCGSIGRRHIKNLKSLIDCEVLAYRVRKESLGDFEKEFNIQTFHDYDKALAEKPDAVFVTNPTSHHLETALKAAKSGCSLFIEKPVSHTLEGIDELISICNEKKLVAFVAYKMRFHKSIRQIKAWIDEGVLGKVVSIRAHYGGHLPSWHPWEDYRRMYSARKDLGGGVLLDCSHEIDYVLWFLGEIEQAQGFSGQLSDLEIETEDVAEILVRSKTGVFGTVHLNYLQQPERRYCEVIGTRGTAFWDQSQKKVTFTPVDKNEKEICIAEGQYDTKQDMFVEEMKHFLDCLKGITPPLSDLRSGKSVLEVIEQVKKQQKVSV